MGALGARLAIVRSRFAQVRSVGSKLLRVFEWKINLSARLGITLYKKGL